MQSRLAKALPVHAFTAAERRLIARLRTPLLVQRFLNRLPYNMEPPPKRDTLRSFRQVLRHRTAHCLEAALFAACVLEQHGYPPLLLTFESVDGLDHVLFLYRARNRRGGWGTVARSRDPGLHGRKPVFRTLRALTMNYFDAYIDPTGCITGYGRYDLRELGSYDWRFARKNMWAVERTLIKVKHRRVRVPRRRITRMRARYLAYRAKYGKKPLFYRGRENWTEIPTEFL